MVSSQAPLRAGLTHSQPVPRHLVHRTAIAEVFPTDSAVDGDDILVTCQFPVGHRLYNDRAQPFVDPLLILEAARQSALLSCLRHLAAAEDVTFVVRTVELHILRPLPHTPGSPPWNVHFRCTPRDLRTVDGAFAGGQLDLTLIADGHETAFISFTFGALPPELYTSLRDSGLRRAREFVPVEPVPSRRPLEPEWLGREHYENVVVAEPIDGSSNDLPVIVRTDHPGYFDHPLDHVSAAVMVEASRQAAHAACPTPATECDLTRLSAGFTSFAELGVPLTARVSDGSPCVEADSEATVELVQFDSVIATVTVGLRSIERKT